MDLTLGCVKKLQMLISITSHGERLSSHKENSSPCSAEAAEAVGVGEGLKHAATADAEPRSLEALPRILITR